MVGGGLLFIAITGLGALCDVMVQGVSAVNWQKTLNSTYCLSYRIKKVAISITDTINGIFYPVKWP